MRPVKILLRPKRPRSRTIKVYTNVRHRQRHPKQLHLGYVGIDENLEAAKDGLFKVLLEKWPRTLKPKAIDWDDAEAKLAELKRRLGPNNGPGNDGGVADPPSALVDKQEPVGPLSVEKISRSEGEASTSVEVAWSASSPAPTKGTPRSALRDYGGFDELVAQHRQSLTQMARRLTRDKITADDLIQDTLVRGFKHFGQFQQGTNFRAWLARILTRQYLDSLRQTRRVDRMHAEFGEEFSETTESGEDDRLTIEVTQNELAMAIEQLDPDLRLVIDCVYFKRMRYREAAEYLRLPIGTIGTRMIRARSALMAIIGKLKKQ